MTDGMTDRTVELTVNGMSRSATTEVRTTLADFLRDKLELTAPTWAASTACAARARCW